MKLNQFSYSDDCIKVYDPIKKECIAVYNSYYIAEKVLGLNMTTLKSISRNKTKRFSPFLNKEIAVRISAKEKDEK